MFMECEHSASVLLRTTKPSWSPGVILAPSRMLQPTEGACCWQKAELTCTQTGLQEDYKHGRSPKSDLQPTERSQDKQHCFKEK